MRDWTHGYSRLATVFVVALLLAGTVAPTLAHPGLGVQEPAAAAPETRMAQEYPFRECVWDLINELGVEYFWAGYDLAYATDLA